MLTQSQNEAIAFIRDSAKAKGSAAKKTIDHILAMSDISKENYVDFLQQLKASARVAFHFHPDRLDPKNKSVAESLLESGVYKSQFETQLSNGSLSAFPGGDRDLWEKRLFGDTYHKKDTFLESPKYGALDFLAHPDGPSPRFGSCYFLLKPSCTERCTFSYLDSNRDPADKGTLDQFDAVLAALFEASFSDEVVLGERLRPKQFVQSVLEGFSLSFQERMRRPHRRILDHYVEAQVHGNVSLKDDIESLVADPSFKNTEVGNLLESLCKNFEIQMHWHAGFYLLTKEVPTDFRGAKMPSLAERVAPDGILNAYKIGLAAKDLKMNPASWADRGDFNFVLQELKLLWHVLLRYGQPKTEVTRITSI
jgi:hypothetical protein